METVDLNRVKVLAMGRLFLLGSRPHQPGDEAQCDMVRAVMLAQTEEELIENLGYLGISGTLPRVPTGAEVGQGGGR